MFNRGQQYTRAGIQQALELPVSKGGIWATGHVRHAGQHFIFCGIDSPGRTGQNYANRFDGEVLVWHPREDARLTSPMLAELVSGVPTVHVFYRSDNRAPFIYAGVGKPASVREGPPIEVRWVFDQGDDVALAEEVTDPQGVIEGAKKQVTVNAYERDPTAKPRCIKRWGTLCAICGFNFGAVYGQLGEGFIHVHHLKPLHTIGAEYVLDPEKDLRPVCPNCHSMLHRRKETLAVEDLKELLKLRFSQSFVPVK